VQPTEIAFVILHAVLIVVIMDFCRIERRSIVNKLCVWSMKVYRASKNQTRLQKSDGEQIEDPTTESGTKTIKDL
jgi:hypothetical protein